jgi:hypothetical protein
MAGKESAMPTDYLPRRESELLLWSTNFDRLINLTPTEYGLTADQAAAYNVLHTAFTAALHAASEPSTRTPSVIVTKNRAKEALIDDARELARLVQATPTVTDTQRSDLGLTVRDVEPTPVPEPKEPPDIDVLDTEGRTITIRVHEKDNPTKRGRPWNARGVAVFSYVGETPPDALKDWHFEGNTNRTTVDITLDDAVPGGAAVWLTAYWIGTRMESGPATQPVKARIPGGLSHAA